MLCLQVKKLMLQYWLNTYRILKSLNILQFDGNVLSLSGVAIPRTGMATPRMMLATSKTFAPLFCECTATCFHFFVSSFWFFSVQLLGVFIMEYWTVTKRTRQDLFFMRHCLLLFIWLVDICQLHRWVFILNVNIGNTTMNAIKTVK